MSTMYSVAPEFNMYIVTVIRSTDWEGDTNTVDMITASRDDAINRANLIAQNVSAERYDFAKVEVAGTVTGLRMEPIAIYTARLTYMRVDDFLNRLDITAGDLNVERDAASDENGIAETLYQHETALSKRSQLVGKFNALNQ